MTDNVFQIRSFDVRWRLLEAARDRIAVAETLETLIEVVRGTARAVCSADGVTKAFVLRDGDKCHYVEEDAIGPLWKGQRFPLETCISGWAMLNSKTVAIRDIFADDRIPHDAYRATFVKSLVMVPVRTVARRSQPSALLAPAQGPSRCRKSQPSKRLRRCRRRSDEPRGRGVNTPLRGNQPRSTVIPAERSEAPYIAPLGWPGSRLSALLPRRLAGMTSRTTGRSNLLLKMEARNSKLQPVIEAVRAEAVRAGIEVEFGATFLAGQFLHPDHQRLGETLAAMDSRQIRSST